MEWRGGFGVAACSILTAFFAQDADFLDPVTRVDFSKAMLKQNRFIFRDNSGLIPKVSDIIIVTRPSCSFVQRIGWACGDLLSYFKHSRRISISPLAVSKSPP